FAIADGAMTATTGIGLREDSRSRGLFIGAGVAFIVLGLVVLFWPSITVTALVLLFALWLIASGALVVYGARALRTAVPNAWITGAVGVVIAVIGLVMALFGPSTIEPLLPFAGWFGVLVGLIMIAPPALLRSYVPKLPAPQSPDGPSRARGLRPPRPGPQVAGAVVVAWRRVLLQDLRLEARRGVELGQARVAEVDDVRGHLLLGRRAHVQPPLGRAGDHADQGLRVDGGGARVEPPRHELLLEDVGDVGGGVVEQRRVRAAAGRRRLAHQDPEPVRALLHVPQERHGGALEPAAGAVALERFGDLRAQVGELAVTHHRVQALFPAEVLVDHRLGHARDRGDLLDGRRVVAVFGKGPAPDLHQLLAALCGRHPGPRRWSALHGHRVGLLVARTPPSLDRAIARAYARL